MQGACKHALEFAEAATTRESHPPPPSSVPCFYPLLLPLALSLVLQTPYKFPDKDGMSDVTSRTVVVRKRRQKIGMPVDAGSSSIANARQGSQEGLSA